VSGHPGEGEGRPAVDRATTETLLPTLIEAALAAVIVMDEHGVVTAWSHRAEQTFGWPASEAVGACLVDMIVPPQYRQAHMAGLANFRRTGDGPVLGQVLELSALHRDGREFPVELRISRAAEVDGVTLFIAFLLDIGERKTREAELVIAYEDARTARKAIEEFVSMVVHELRQPVGVMMGYADLLLQGLPAEDERRYRAPLTAILEKSQEALTLISEVLTAAKLEAGGMTARREVVDLTAHVRGAVRRGEPAAALRDGTVSISDAPSMRVLGDGAFIDLILDNLVNNAITYSPVAPEVRVDLRGGVRDGEEVEVLVSDSGKGVPPEMQDRIFERFVRVQDHTAEPGTGLGLFIARHLAERQGGSLRLVSSWPGEGSVFSLRLPAAPADEGS
jgi:PAS domain S-box-containing protein